MKTLFILLVSATFLSACAEAPVYRIYPISEYSDSQSKPVKAQIAEVDDSTLSD